MLVYQYSVAGPLKNFLDITTKAFKYKFIAIAMNSSGVRSYLAADHLMRTLSFEAFALPIMPIVHSWQGDFEGETLKNQKIFERLKKCLKH